MTVVDPKALRVRCPTCFHPEPLLATACMTCGALLDPHKQFETYEKAETRTQ